MQDRPDVITDEAVEKYLANIKKRIDDKVRPDSDEQFDLGCRFLELALMHRQAKALENIGRVFVYMQAVIEESDAKKKAGT